MNTEKQVTIAGTVVKIKDIMMFRDQFKKFERAIMKGSRKGNTKSSVFNEIKSFYKLLKPKNVDEKGTETFVNKSDEAIFSKLEEIAKNSVNDKVSFSDGGEKSDLLTDLGKDFAQAAREIDSVKKEEEINKKWAKRKLHRKHRFTFFHRTPKVKDIEKRTKLRDKILKVVLKMFGTSPEKRELEAEINKRFGKTENSGFDKKSFEQEINNHFNKDKEDIPAPVESEEIEKPVETTEQKDDAAKQEKVKEDVPAPVEPTKISALFTDHSDENNKKEEKPLDKNDENIPDAKEAQSEEKGLLLDPDEVKKQFQEILSQTTQVTSKTASENEQLRRENATLLQEKFEMAEANQDLSDKLKIQEKATKDAELNAKKVKEDADKKYHSEIDALKAQLTAAENDRNRYKEAYMKLSAVTQEMLQTLPNPQVTETQGPQIK